MAKCEKRQIVPEPPPVEYVLTLNLQEATILAKMLGTGRWPTSDEECANFHGRILGDIFWSGLCELRGLKSGDRYQ